MPNPGNYIALDDQALLSTIIKLRNGMRDGSVDAATKNELTYRVNELCERMLEKNRRVFLSVMKKMPRASYRDRDTDLLTDIFFSVCDVLDKFSSDDWSEATRFVMTAFKRGVSRGGRRKDAHFLPEDTVAEESYAPEFDQELACERSQRMLNYLSEMSDLIIDPSKVFPANFDYLHKYTAGLPGAKYSKQDVAFDGAAVGLNHDVLFNRFVDKKNVIGTSWHVTGDVLGALVNAGRMLGKSEFSLAENSLLYRITQADQPASPDFEFALVQLEYAEDLLLMVLSNPDLGKDSDPLTKYQVYELLGIIRHAMKLYPENYHDNVWECVDSEIEDDEYGFDLENLPPLRVLIEIAVNTALGFCNTGFSLLGVKEDIAKAETAHENERYATVEALYQKNINRLHGYLMTYVIRNKAGNLPNTSRKRKSAAGSSKTSYEIVDTQLRKKMREAVMESFSVKNDFGFLVKQYLR